MLQNTNYFSKEPVSVFVRIEEFEKSNCEFRQNSRILTEFVNFQKKVYTSTDLDSFDRNFEF